MLTVALIVLVLVAINGVFVAGEFATVGSSHTRVRRLADGGNRTAVRLLPILQDPGSIDDVVAACQIGITAASLLLGYYGQRAIAPRLEPLLAQTAGLDSVAATSLAVTLVLLLLTTVQVVFGELVPKAMALRHPERLVLTIAVPLLLSVRFLRPFIQFFNGSASLLLRLVGVGEAARHTHLHSPAEIEFLVAETASAGRLDPVEREMLQNALDFSQLMARQVMIPRNKLELADIETGVDDLLALLAASPFSRIPVFEGTPDHIAGVVHFRDLLRLQARGTGRVADVVKTVPFVPETAAVSRLWQLLILQGNPLAIVIDEYGGTAGLVTQTDLLEEVIGEVPDEFDLKPDRIIVRPGAPPVVRGDVLVEDVNAELGTDLPLDRADTIGGLVLDLLGRIPKAGEEVAIDGVTLRVERVEERAIARVAVVTADMAGSEADSRVGDA